MNRLDVDTRTRIVACLVEGNSICATCQMTGAAKGTVLKLLSNLGTVCSIQMDRHMRDLPCQRLQVDEIWSFCYSKEKNVPAGKEGAGYGDVWTWVALDADTKLVPTYHVGSRDLGDAREFMQDVAKRIRNRVQLTTDAHRPYLTAVPGAFKGEIDYAQLQKIYGSGNERPSARYSQPKCIGTATKVRSGNLDPEHINTSFVERQNLTMRMSIRRFTRLTNGFSKKIENHTAAVSLHFAHYNYCRVHASLGTTPAVAAGITDRTWTLAELIALLEAAEATPIKRGPYKRRSSAISD